MQIALRLVITLAGLALAGFCLFGFLATFEPLPPLQRWAWRAAYGLIGLLSVWAVVRVWRPRPKRDSL